MFIYSNSKLKVADFECQYIRTHTKEKSSKISNITFAILPCYKKKKLKYSQLYSNWMAILSALESTAFDEMMGVVWVKPLTIISVTLAFIILSIYTLGPYAQKSYTRTKVNLLLSGI